MTTKLSDPMTFAHANLRSRGSGWHPCHVSSLTLDALVKRGLVAVRSVPAIGYGMVYPRERQWRDATVPAPAPTRDDLFANLIASATNRYCSLNGVGDRTKLHRAAGDLEALAADLRAEAENHT